MKKILSILFVLVGFYANAQVQPPVVPRSSQVLVAEDFRLMAGLNFYPPRVRGVPNLPPLFQNGGVDSLGALVYNELDSSYYKYIGASLWEKELNIRNQLTSGSYINIVAGAINLDTVHYRKADTAYGLNDSTLIVPVNGIPHTIILRGGSHGGGGGTGTVTTVSGVNANGFTWSIANPSSAPALSLFLNANAVAYTQIQQENSFSLLGNSTNATANTGAVGLGWGLRFVSTNLQSDSSAGGTVSWWHLYNALDSGLAAAANLNLQQVTNNGNTTTNSITANSLVTNVGTNAAQFTNFSNGFQAWNQSLTGVQSGTNTGANWALQRYSDAGALIDNPVTIRRSTGAASFLDSLVAIGHTYLEGGLNLLTGANDTKNAMYYRDSATGNFVSMGSPSYGQIPIAGFTGVQWGYPATTQVASIVTVTSNYTIATSTPRTTVIFNATSGSVVLPDPTISSNIGRFFYIETGTSGQSATVTSVAGSIQTAPGSFSSSVTISGSPTYGWMSDGSNYRLSY